MPQTSSNSSAAKLQKYASVFAALGDATRLALVAKLSEGCPASISQLTKGSNLTRQAVTKHLQVLKDAGLVSKACSGRESLFTLDLRPFKDIDEYLGFLSMQLYQALPRLNSFFKKY